MKWNRDLGASGRGEIKNELACVGDDDEIAAAAAGGGSAGAAPAARERGKLMTRFGRDRTTSVRIGYRAVSWTRCCSEARGVAPAGSSRVRTTTRYCCYYRRRRAPIHYPAG